MTTPAGAATLTKPADYWLLSLSGEHDLMTAPALEQQMQQVAASGTSVVIDLSDASFVECQVMAWLVRWSDVARQSSHLHLSVATGENTAAKRLIDILGLHDALPCHTSRAEAVVAITTESAAQASEPHRPSAPTALLDAATTPAAAR